MEVDSCLPAGKASQLRHQVPWPSLHDEFLTFIVGAPSFDHVPAFSC